MEIIATNENFSDILKSKKPVLVDFWATWCGPCRALSPVVEEIAKDFEGKVDVVKCNVDDCGDISMQFGIRSIPTLIYLKDGEVVDKSIGIVSKADIEGRLNKLLQ